ncbi:phage tail tape measure protein [Sphingobacterium faecium]|uniref:phage tail tape measure protein n=1 Tax=Sphingobacterium faecium TaxID=34087 RepID=UPI0032097377
MAKKLSEEDLVLNIIVNGNKAQSDIGKVSRTLMDAKTNLKAAQTEMKALEKQGKTNSTRYQTLTADIAKYNAAITESKKKLGELNQSLKLEDQSQKQLEGTLRRLKALRKDAIPDSKNHIAYGQQIEVVQKRLDELTIGANRTGNSLMKMGNRLNQYIGAIAAGGASLVAMWTGIKSTSEEYLKFDDILADVMKTTNLTKESAKELNTELEKIETRTNQEDRLGLARIAGKLGYQDIGEITEFVRANNQIIVSLNEDLGGNVEETVNKIGKLVDVFKLKDLYTTEEAFLNVGSAINELGMASTANEGYMVEFARRMAGVAPLAGITIEQILGLGATLDQLGQSEEVSSTALSKMFLSMAKNAEVYSKYAGMQVTEFKDLLEKDFMGAFTKVLSGVKSSSNGINELAETLSDLGEDGGRVIGVIGTLANNVDILKGSIKLSNKAFADGTSITNEYNIKNQTAAARLEMAKNEAAKYRRELGEKLYPILTTSVNLTTMFIRVLSTLVTFFADNAKSITLVTVALVGWTVAANANAIAQYAVAKGTAVATAAQKLWNIAMAANPIGLFITVLATLITGVLAYGDSLKGIIKTQDSLNNAMKKASEDTAAQLSEIDSLNKVMTDNKVANDKRIAAMDQLKQIMPGVLDGYSKEELLLGKATSAINTYSEALVLNSQIQAQRNELNNLAEKELKIKNNDFGWMTSTYRFLRQGVIGETAAIVENAADTVESLQNINKARKELTDGILANQQKLNKIVVKKSDNDPTGDQESTVIGGKTQKELEKAAREAEAASKKARLKELEEAKKGYQDQLIAAGLYQKERSTMTAEELDKLAIIEAEYQKKSDAINRKYNHSLQETTKLAESELIKREASERRYRDQLLDKSDPLLQQEKAAYQKRLEDAGLFGKERELLTAEQLTALETLENNHRKNINKIDADAIAKHTDQVLAKNNEELAELRIKHNIELSEITTLAQAKEVLSNQLSEKELRAVTSLGQARKLIQNQQDLEEQQLKKDQLEKLLLIMQATIESGQMEGINLSDTLLSEEEQEILKKKILAIKEELAKLKGTDKTDELKNPDDKVDILGMSKADWENLFTNVVTTEEKLLRVFGALNAATDVWKQYNSFIAAGENAQLQKDEQANKKKKSNLDSRLKSGTISQESYNKQVEKLDKDLEKKKSEVAYKQAKRERNVALMSAVVNTATAVTKALPNIFLAALVGAMGALQIGTILKTPLPAIEGREDGGYMDVTRSQDGKQFRAKNRPNQRGMISQPTVIVGENGKEWVASASTVNNPFAAPIISLLDTMQSNGRIDPAVLSNIITSTMPGRVNGGYLNNNSSRSSTAAPGQTTIVNESDEEIRKLIANNTAVTNALYQAVKNGVSVSLLGPEGFKAKMAELDRIQNNADL